MSQRQTKTPIHHEVGIPIFIEIILLCGRIFAEFNSFFKNGIPNRFAE